MMVFDCFSYREIISLKLKENIQTRGYKSKLSEVMDIQISHFSSVLKGKIELKSEQGIMLCHFWNFSRSETDYFITLLEMERTINESLKQHYMSRLNEIKKSRLSGSLKKRKYFDLDERIKRIEKQIGSIVEGFNSLEVSHRIGA